MPKVYSRALTASSRRCTENTAVMRTIPKLLIGDNQAVVLSGFILIVAGPGFKLFLVSLHLWTPDVYQGAPAPIAAFITTVSKGPVFVLLLRYIVIN
jgi:NADH:ubiquinone oxidoreductase subunit 2 (subunit N)